jgi:TolB-like protein/DNA-binding winged helix-turn-helix (wHTH) protein/tetratricopeptide (TPR) repeat protein
MNDLLKGFQLGEFEVLPLQGRIRGPAGDMAVHPRAMEVLMCLVDSPGELLEREYIQQRVWGSLPVSDATLTRCIGELRHALDDHHEQPRYIQTVQKRGYRLVAPVRRTDARPRGATAAAGAHGSEAPAADAVATASPSFWHELSRRRVIRVAIAYAVVAWVVTEVASTVFPGLMLPDWTVTLVIILAVLGFPVAVMMAWALQLSEGGVEVDRGGLFGTAGQRKYVLLGIGGVALVTVGAVGLFAKLWPSLERGEAPVAPPIHESIAVLPFVNIGDDPGLDYFGDGLAEELTTMLAKVGDLAVASRTAAFYFGHEKFEFPRIAESLRVKHILEGSVRRETDRLRVNAQLIDATTGYHVWSEVYDRNIQEVFGILDDITRNVVGQMGVELSAELLQLLAEPPTADAVAYELYMRAMGLMRQPHSDALLAQAQRLFEDAVGRDPEFASAYAGLCEAHLFQYIRDTDPATFRQAESHCGRAVALAASKVEVRMAVGHLHRRSGRLEDAVREYHAVLALEPRHYDALINLAETYLEMNRPEEAEPLYQQAIALEPSFWQGYNYLAIFYLRTLQNEAAAENFRQVTELRPDDPVGYINLGATLLNQDLDGALEAWTRALERSDTPSHVLLSNIGLAHFYRGEYERAAEFQRKAVEVQPREVRAWARLAAALRQLPDEQGSYREALERAIRLLLQRLALNPGSTTDLSILATSYAWIGDRQEAEHALARLRDLAPDQAQTWYTGAKVAIALGELEIAAEHVREALQRGYPVAIARVDPELEPIRSTGAMGALIEAKPTEGE